MSAKSMRPKAKAVAPRLTPVITFDQFCAATGLLAANKRPALLPYRPKTKSKAR